MATGCNSYRKMMQAALDEELGSGDRARLDAHLASCGACKQELSSLELSMAVFEALPAPEPGPGFAAGAVRKARRARQVQVRRHTIFAWTMVAAIAAASATALGAWGQVFAPAAWEVLTWIPRGLSALWSLATALSGTLATLVNSLLPLGNVAAGLAWDGLLVFFPLYAAALVAMVFITLIARSKRPVAMLPVLSL